MPIVRYILKSEEGDLPEEDIFPRCKQGESVADVVMREVVNHLNENRTKYGQPKLEIAATEVKNPWLHRHEQVFQYKSHIDRRVHYKCAHCSVTFHRSLTVVNGEGKEFVRDEIFAAEKFANCAEPLKPMPAAGRMFS